MTTPKPLSKSPLHLIKHEFTTVSIVSSELEDPQGRFAMTTTRVLHEHETNERQFLLTLTVKVSSGDPDKEAPYTAELVVRGEFEVSEKYPEIKRSELVQVTGASMLYGACREMLANITARSSHGITSLPSISFVETKKAKAVKRPEGDKP